MVHGIWSYICTIIALMYVHIYVHVRIERERGGGRGRKKCKTNEYRIKTNFKKQVEYDEASDYVLLS